jgi:hypothetical protein
VGARGRRRDRRQRRRVSYSAIAPAAATLSDSAPGSSGIVTRASHFATTSSGRPSRSDPSTNDPETCPESWTRDVTCWDSSPSTR